MTRHTHGRVVRASDDVSMRRLEKEVNGIVGYSDGPAANDGTRHEVVLVGDYEKHFLSLDLSRGRIVEEALDRYQCELQRVKDLGVEVVSERMFGDLRLRADVDMRRRRVFEGLTTPPQLTYLEGLRGEGTVAGSVLYGLRARRPGSVAIERHLFDGETVPATAVSAAGARELFVSGATDDGAVSEDPGRCFTLALDRVAATIQRHGFATSDIVRTWIYLSDIGRDYVAFNQARRQFFLAHGIAFGADAVFVPASTGIESRSDNRTRVTIDAFCIDRSVSTCRVKRIHNALQPEAEGDRYPMKPTFSRAVLIEGVGHREMQLSGTASIDEHGNTVFVDSPTEQIRTTLRNIMNLLEAGGLTINDIRQATYHFKDRRTLAAFDQVGRAMGFGEVKGPRVLTNICRQELLFEMDGIALSSTAP